MPRKNSVKMYLENGYYHIYNRGVEKRIIFIDDRDYKTFLHFLKQYLDPEKKINQNTSLVNLMNLSDEIDLLSFCLMPNHFHLLVHQQTRDGIKKFVQRVATNYVMYFNKRYNRVGPLFQGIYKAVLVEKEGYLLHLSRYIHRNPLDIERVESYRGSNPHVSLIGYPYSSYGDYLGQRVSSWIKPKIILDYFSSEKATLQKKFKSYQMFVESEIESVDESIQSLGIDSEIASESSKKGFNPHEDV